MSVRSTSAKRTHGAINGDWCRGLHIELGHLCSRQAAKLRSSVPSKQLQVRLWAGAVAITLAGTDRFAEMVERRRLRAAARSLQIRYGRHAHYHLGRSCDAWDVVQTDGKSAVADEFRRWRHHAQPRCWFRGAPHRPEASGAQ